MDTSLAEKHSNSKINSESSMSTKSSSELGNISSNFSSFYQNIKSKLQRSFYSLLSMEKEYNRNNCMSTLDELREGKQEIFNKEVEQLLKNFLIKYFKEVVSTMRSNNNENDILPRNIYDCLSYALLKNAQKFYKMKINNYNRRNSNKSLINYEIKQKREIVLYSVCGKYRKLFEGFDDNTTFNEKALSSSQAFREPRYQIYWNMDSLTSTTKFVFDFEVNQVLGINKKHKYRLINHHPHLMRYILDSNDIQWFKEQQLLKTDEDGLASRTTSSLSTSSSTTTTSESTSSLPSRIFLLVLEQILELPEKFSVYHRQYKHLNLSHLNSFTIPEFMLKKMRLYFIHLQIESDGFITTVRPRNYNDIDSNYDSGSPILTSILNEFYMPAPNCFSDPSSSY